ncbi:hypothetical protein OBBRIDRAFT_95021 [Obba rivulosa]|uniref:Uncharacterized protein n=1 Tax=Obba rivulosa TaxID=1052685 RepID=A0A8E2DHK7_9APHY|nr:hypothetical protein OBBRIDRAFT_95021 [Obba rivulosa]
MTSEDVQPNEIRLARKGSVTVPRIRPSRPTNAREPFKGTPRGRGGSHFGTTARPTARTTIWSTSNARAGPSSGGSWFPPHARPGSGGLDQHGPEHPQKKRRIEDHKRSPSFFAAGVPGPPFRGPQSHPKMLGKFKPVENFVDLPEDCWKSAPRCHSNRRAWVQRQVSLMQAEQKMQVINHAFLDFQQYGYVFR